MRKGLPFRAVYYFRQGWALYFAFVFAALNTLIVTYFLAIEKIPALKEVFPSFTIYVIFAVGVGIPLLTLIGHIHFKRSKAFGSEVDIGQESYPYNFKLPPGYWREVLTPALINMMNLRMKILEGKSLSEVERKDINKILDKLTILQKGGFVTKPKRMS